MRFCIYGAGAIGGYVAVELASAGHDVWLIARGATVHPSIPNLEASQ